MFLITKGDDMAKITINELSTETIERFKKALKIENINSEKRIKQGDLFKKMVDEFTEKHVKPFYEQIKNPFDGDF